LSAFFDTNVLVYAQGHGAKAQRARTRLAAGGALSVQVLNEFAAVARRKLGRVWSEIATSIDDIRALVETPRALTLSTHENARALASAHNFAFNDALILAAALEAGCDIRYTEDMQAGRVVGTLKIVDPFAN